jgi:alpha-ketoglutarate-dependent sulfate ester dioxygenase
MLQSHITKLENTVATQHCAINDYGDQKRVVRRSTVRGQVPVSIDGGASMTRCKPTKRSVHSKQSAAVYALRPRRSCYQL